MPVPRTLWMLWLQGRENAPRTVQRCFQSWEQLNSGWDIQFLTAEDVGDYLDLDGISGGSPDEITPQKLSNWIRINLLDQHGGVWADATCLCMQPLDAWIHDWTGSGFFAFSTPGPDRLMSNWFLASDTQCALTSRLCDVVNTYYKANDFEGVKGPISRYAAKAARRFAGEDPWRSALFGAPLFAQYVGYTPYFIFHYSFAYTLLMHRDARRVWSNTPKISADGPHLIQHHGMYEPVSDSLAARISGREDPIYKLNWREGTDQDASDAAVEYALHAVGV